MRTALIGGLGPLSRPGMPWAGRELFDAMHLAVREVNRTRSAGRRSLQLLWENTSGSPAAAVDAVNRLCGQGVHAFAGEFHSVAANAVVDPIGQSGLPFVCASATLDRITSCRRQNVFRLSPPQSYGWRVYADYIVGAGIKHVIAVAQDNIYWSAGATAIESALRESGVAFTRFDTPDALTTTVEHLHTLMERPGPHMLLLLRSYPDDVKRFLARLGIGKSPALSIVLGDPAGRPIFRDWWEISGAVGVPFLAYEHPRKLTDCGESTVALFEREYGREPTFVALEGYDSVLALAAAIKEAGSIDPPEVCRALRHIEIRGTRSLIRFSTEAQGVVHQQWTWAPTLVAAFAHPYQRFSDCDILWEATADRYLEHTGGALAR